MQVEDLRTRSFLGIMEPPRWKTGIWQQNRRLRVKTRDTKWQNIVKIKWMYFYPRKSDSVFMHLCVSYRAHGHRDVKVLGSVVLLVGVDVKPDLKETHTERLGGGFSSSESSWICFTLLTPHLIKVIQIRRWRWAWRCQKEKCGGVKTFLSHLVFSRQVGGDSSGSLLSDWMHQQVSPCSRVTDVSGTDDRLKHVWSYVTNFKSLSNKKAQF